MKSLLNNVIKDKSISLIKEIGSELNELVFTMDLEIGEFNSIEYYEEIESIVLHKFKSPNLDMIFDYDLLSEKDRLLILSKLREYSTSK